MLKNPTKMDELNENKTEHSQSTILKCFLKTGDNKLSKQQTSQQQQTPHIHNSHIIIRNNNNVNGKHASGNCSSSSGSSSSNNIIDGDTEINDCTKLECRRLSAATENSVKLIVDETSIDISRILHENESTTSTVDGALVAITPNSSSARSSPPHDINSTASTSTDNLSFGSEADLINDIVLLPNNFISEDEISVNSDDCVYAYRGRDVDAGNNGGCGGVGGHIVGGSGGGAGGVHHMNGGDFSQDDDPDYIEMDFDPDPPSDAAPTNDEQSEIGTKHIVPINDENGDIKIPREIDKIGEVVELNSMRCREMHDVPSSVSMIATTTTTTTATIPNQRFDFNKDKEIFIANSNDDTNDGACSSVSILQCNVEQPLSSLTPIPPTTPVKYTGTKPKIRSSVRRQSSEKLNCGDAVVPPSSSSTTFSYDYSVASMNNDDSNCYDCRHKLYNELAYNGIGTPCKRCKLNQKQSKLKSSPQYVNTVLYDPLNSKQDGNYFDDQPTCSAAASSLSDKSKPAADWNHGTYDKAISVGRQCESPSMIMMMDQCSTGSPDIIDLVLCCDDKKMNDDASSILTATFETLTCTKAIIIEKLTRIGIEPNINEISQYFDQKSIPPMTITEYLLYMSKLYCDHKTLKSTIRSACTDIPNFSIEFVPDSTMGPCTEIVQVSVLEIMRRWTKTTNLETVLRIRNQRFYTMNVLGKLANIVRQYAGKPLGAIDANQYIEIPQYYKNGYFILTKQQSND